MLSGTKNNYHEQRSINQYQTVSNALIMYRLPAILLIFLNCQALFTQEQLPFSLFGSVVDKTDQSPIPYVNVVVEGENRGTVTNELGEFILKVDSLPVRLAISHVGYDWVGLAITTASEPIRLLLEPSTLQSVTITSKRANKNKNILEKALARTLEHSKESHYGRAFYRQLSKNDSTYNELYEIFFDTRFNADGINDWAIEQGRYALLERTKGERFVFNKNFTLIDRIFPTIQPDIEEYITPLRENGIYYFETEMTSSFIKADGREVAVVAFKPRSEAVGDTPAMIGELYIDLKTYDILKMAGRFETDNLDVIELQGDGKFVDYVLYYEAAFKHNEEGDLLMDYIKVRQTSDVVYEDYPTRKLETNSLLTFFEYYIPTNKKSRLGGRLRFRQSDQDLINKVEYDPVFWQENPIVKRTPVEEKVIATFEQDRQFGSIYLNNKNQVSLLPDLDRDPVVKELVEKMAKNIPVHEKVYVQTDKPYYARGETLWFKAYVTDAIVHRPYNQSWAMYVELINPAGQEVANRKLQVQGAGFAEGDFLIYPGYLSGTYLLRAYTDQMRFYDRDYFFEKEIEIYTGLQPQPLPSKAPDFDLQLFPEGGNLVYGIPSHVAFKAVDENGNPKTVEGFISDENGDTLMVFESKHDGMGSFVLNPQTGKQYFAVANDGRIEKRVSLPDPLEEGYVMSVANKGDRNLTVRVLCSPSLDNSTVYLIGQVRQHIFYKGKGSLKRQLLTFEIPRSVLPNGILHLTLMDSLHRPFCERLTFIDNDDHLELTITPNKKKYGKGSTVDLNLRLRNPFGDPMVAELSMAVTDAGQIQLPKYEENIKTYLLLSSDLKGKINDPAFYFQEDQPASQYLLDLVMMTNGWSRFTWQQVLRKSVAHRVPREGFDVCGKMREDDFEKFGRTVLSMISVGNEPGLYTATVNQNGEFCFANINFRDTSNLVIQAIDDNGKYHEVSVTLNESNNLPNDHLALPQLPPNELVTNYLNLNEVSLQEQLYFDGTSISLNEITVTGKKKEQTKGYRTFHPFADYVVEIDEQNSDLLTALNGRVPGLVVQPGSISPTIHFSNRTAEPLVLLDGIPVNIQSYTNTPVLNEPNTLSGISAYETLRSINPILVDRIEVLRGTGAAMYGAAGDNGVVAVYTKNRGGRKDPLISQTYEGYYTAREFYIPKYESRDRQDLRSTLFWEPSFQTNQQGRARLSFPNSDVAKSFNVVVEGITAEGRPVTGVLRYDWNEGN
jgi:hypothetical protein